MTIGEFASIAEGDVVLRFFKSTMQKLLKVTQDAGGAENFRNSMQIDGSTSDNSLSRARFSTILSYQHHFLLKYFECSLDINALLYFSVQ